MSVKSLSRAVHDDKMKLLIDALVNTHGFSLVSDHKHLIFKGSSGPQIVVPKTASDKRCWHLTISTIRKAAGLDLKYLTRCNSKKGLKAFKMAV